MTVHAWNATGLKLWLGSSTDNIWVIQVVDIISSDE